MTAARIYLEMVDSLNSQPSLPEQMGVFMKFFPKLIQETTKDNLSSDYSAPDSIEEKIYALAKRILNLANQNLDARIFPDAIKIAIITNDDDSLESLLKNSQDKIKNLNNHREFINEAIKLKSTRTLKILLDHGFDPNKFNRDDATEIKTLSPIALAAQDQGSVYFAEYLELFGEETFRNLAQELDSKNHNALSHAILGNSYKSTVEFLINHGKVDTSINFDENCTNALQNRHNATLQILLEANPKNINDTLIEQFANVALKSKNRPAFEVLLSKAQTLGTQDFLKNLRGTTKYKNDDIYDVCYSADLNALKTFIKETNLKKPELKTLLNSFKDGKTPIYYALEKNAYATLLEALLFYGADPKKITNHENAQGTINLDAYSMSIAHKQPKCLEVLMQDESFNSSDRSLLNKMTNQILDPLNRNSQIAKIFANNLPKIKPANFDQIEKLAFKNQSNSKTITRQPDETTPLLSNESPSNSPNNLFSDFVECISALLRIGNSTSRH